jgi:hypothetical protein
MFVSYWASTIVQRLSWKFCFHRGAVELVNRLVELFMMLRIAGPLLVVAVEYTSGGPAGCEPSISNTKKYKH